MFQSPYFWALHFLSFHQVNPHIHLRWSCSFQFYLIHLILHSNWVRCQYRIPDNTSSDVFSLPFTLNLNPFPQLLTCISDPCHHHQIKSSTCFQHDSQLSKFIYLSNNIPLAISSLTQLTLSVIKVITTNGQSNLTSPPHMDSSIIFARLCQCVPHLVHPNRHPHYLRACPGVAPFALQNFPFILPPSNIVPWPTWFNNPNGITIASTTFARLMVVTDRPCYSICSNRLHLASFAMQPNNNNTTYKVLQSSQSILSHKCLAAQDPTVLYKCFYYIYYYTEPQKSSHLLTVCNFVKS